MRQFALLLPAAAAAVTSALLAHSLSVQELPGRIDLPADFRTSLEHYATVDRADGKVYELYIDREGLEGWLAERRLVPGTMLAIESFEARRDAAGEVLRDDVGRHQRGPSDNEIHVSQKQAAWAATEECLSPSLEQGREDEGGAWRMAAFDPRSGERLATASHTAPACHGCHADPRASDFIFSGGLLDRYARTGEPAYIALGCRDREVCFGVAPDVPPPRPDCPNDFAGP